MTEITNMETTLLHAHPKHNFYHTSITEQQELYDYVKQDIQENGIQTPLLVQNRTHLIIDGHMRQQIAMDLQMDEVPVMLMDVSDRDAEVALVNENRKRRALERDPIRIARQVLLLKEVYGLKNGQHGKQTDRLTMQELAKGLGFKPRQLYKYLRLNRLTQEFQRLVSIEILGLKSAVEISYLAHEDQQHFYALITRTGAPKIALAQSIVSAWITEYRANKKEIASGPHFKADPVSVNQVDAVMDAIDQQYDAEEVVGTDKLLRQSITALAESLTEESGMHFVQAVADRNAQKHLRSLKRVESRLMAILLPDAIPDSAVLDEMSRVLTRVATKLEEVRTVLNG